MTQSGTPAVPPSAAPPPGESRGCVLVVDDEAELRQVSRTYLEREGYEVREAANPLEARAILEELDALGLDVVLLDIMMPHESGLDLLASVRESRPHLSVVMVTASGSVMDAVVAMKRGAVDYLQKPVRRAELLEVVARAAELTQQHRELAVRRALDPAPRFVDSDAVFTSRVMRPMLDLVEHVKDSRVPVLLMGESGTGKEVMARYIHRRSARRDKPFVAVNCAALPKDLVESELFGHEKGSFTGAAVRRRGRFEEAQDGTLFLDEVGDLDLSVQAKMLRVLQEWEVTRVGGSTVPVDARVLVATNRDLMADVRAGRFRLDLYYRLEVITLTLPPLRERMEEIPALCTHLVDRFSSSEGLPRMSVSPDALALLASHNWPGNIRELENVVKRAALVCRGGVILPIHIQLNRDTPHAMLPAGAGPHTPGEAGDPPRTPPIPAVAEKLHTPFPFIVAPTRPEDTAPQASGEPLAGPVRRLVEYEAELMMRALAETHGNVAEAARRLGIGRATFYRRAKRYLLPI